MAKPPPKPRRGGVHFGWHSGASRTHAELLRVVPPMPNEVAVAVIPAALAADWALHFATGHGNPQACMIADDLYRLLGFQSHLTPVFVTAHARSGVKVYGEAPAWVRGAYAGYCMVWLPDIGRLVDPLLSAIPEFAGRTHLPYLGQTATAGFDPVTGPLEFGTRIIGSAGGNEFTILVVGGGADQIAGGPDAERWRRRHAPVVSYLAGWALDLYRAIGLDVAAVPRLAWLLDQIGDAPTDRGRSRYGFAVTAPGEPATPVTVAMLLDHADAPLSKQ